MMDNATFRVNMENAANAANVKCHTPIKDPGIQDLLTRLGELVRTNNGLSSISIECKNFRRGTTVQRPVIDYNKLPGGNGLRNPVEKEETL